RDYSLASPRRPSYIVQAETATEVSAIVRLANENKVPLIPASSAVHFHGCTIPRYGGIVLDLTRMNRILEFDEPNRKVKVEPGVTWADLQSYLKERGHMMISPLMPHASRSPLTDYLEREVPVIPVYEFGEPLLSMEIVWPNGDTFRSGTASAPNYPQSFAEGANPHGPGPLNYHRLLEGAQGTIGIVTWANMKMEFLPTINKVFFMPFGTLADAIEPMYRIQRLKLGYECLLLNNINLATIFTEEWPKDFESLRVALPPWTLILILSGGPRRPEEKIAYEERALMQIGKELPHMNILTALPGAPGVERKLTAMLREPWPREKVYWKHAWKGNCQDLFFITRPEMAPGFLSVVGDVAASHGYPVSDIGCYLQPIENARACHLEFNFYYDSESPKERARILRLHSEAAQVALSRDGFFARPYGGIADLVYSKTTDYTTLLRTVKNIFDPNNIMNPGNLCF
ncbi:MAG: FAD-binding oxidoreductase, partial [Chloroflexota bacterium]